MSQELKRIQDRALVIHQAGLEVYKAAVAKEAAEDRLEREPGNEVAMRQLERSSADLVVWESRLDEHLRVKRDVPVRAAVRAWVLAMRGRWFVRNTDLVELQSIIDR